MRVYDSELKLQGDGWSVEVFEYHDERHGHVGPHRWRSRVVIHDDTGISVVNFHRDTQQELYQTLEGVKDAFESAQTLVMDTVGA